MITRKYLIEVRDAILVNVEKHLAPVDDTQLEFNVCSDVMDGFEVLLNKLEPEGVADDKEIPWQDQDLKDLHDLMACRLTANHSGV